MLQKTLAMKVLFLLQNKQEEIQLSYQRIKKKFAGINKGFYAKVKLTIQVFKRSWTLCFDENIFEKMKIFNNKFIEFLTRKKSQLF